MTVFACHSPQKVVSEVFHGPDAYSVTPFPSAFAKASADRQGRGGFEDGIVPVAPAAHGPTVEHSARTFATAPHSTVPAQPVTPSTSRFVEILRELVDQLDDFTLTTKMKIPIKGLTRRENIVVDATMKAVIKNGGELKELELTLKPSAGPYTCSCLECLLDIPILSHLAAVNVLKLKMDPETRKLKACLQVSALFIPIPFPIPWNVHDLMIEKADLETETMRGKGYDLAKRVPEESWQLVDLLQEILDEVEREKEIAEKKEPKEIEPFWDKAEIAVEGNFSNKKISLGGIQVHFDPLPQGQKHRIEVSGKLFEPRMKIWGFRSVHVIQTKTKLSLVSVQAGDKPLEINARYDAEGDTPLSLEIPRYRSDQFYIEATPREDPSLKIHFDLQEGIDVKGFKVNFEKSGPKIAIRELTAKRIGFEGFGVNLRTSEGDQAVFSDIKLDVLNRLFTAQIKGRASGEISYAMEGEELGHVKFAYLKGVGEIEVGDDLRKKRGEKTPFIRVSGQLQTLMPELGLFLPSDKMRAHMRADLVDADVKGDGSIIVWPENHEALLFSHSVVNPITFEANGGLVTFHQDISEAAKRPELASNFFMGGKPQASGDEPLKLKFAFTKLHIRSVKNPQNGKSTMEVVGGNIGPFEATGYFYGDGAVKLPGDICYWLEIPKRAMMKNATLHVEGIDFGAGKRTNVYGIRMRGRESAPTFSEWAQRVCGTDRQEIDSGLQFLFFGPSDEDFSFHGMSPTFRVFLKDGDGCFKIE